MNSTAAVLTPVAPFGELRIAETSPLEFSSAVGTDVPELLAIERESFEYPWSRAEFEYCLAARSCRGIVVKREGETLGYLFYEILNYGFELISCAVRKSERRLGIGTALVRRLMEELDERRCEISCVARERNVPAQLFLRSLGFRVSAIVAYRMRYYSDEWELTTDRSRDRLWALR